MRREDIRRLIEQHEADPDPLDILPELAASRAIFQDFIERYDEWREAFLAWHASFGSSENPNPKPREVLDISDAYRLVSEITKIAERIERIKLQGAQRAVLSLVHPSVQQALQRTVDHIRASALVTDADTLLSEIEGYWQ